ncbi:MAG: hypothetical protein HZC13_06085, partial [Nitrospirae bacterium]|nr:hypothetical protein [Nitrospirota bacterium]
MSIPAISQIRERFPSARITIIGLPYISELFYESPYVDEIWVYSKSLLATVNDIKKYHLDLAILFPNSFRSALMTHLARIPFRCGYNRDGRGFILNLPVKVDSKIKSLHQADYYLNLVDNIAPTFRVGSKWGMNPHATAWADKDAFSDETPMSHRLTREHENSACHPEPKAKGLTHRD